MLRNWYKFMTFDFSKFYSKSVLSVILTTAICTAQADSLRINTASARVVSKDVVIILTEQVDPTGNMEREFRRGTESLYRSRFQPFKQGFSLQVVAGHPSQLGTLRLERQQLSVVDGQGKHLWSEQLKKPLCLPEFIPEFIKAHWDRLAPGSEPLACGVPIIKARKVAPVEWVRLPDGPRGERLVELRPGSFGMRFFLSPTRLTFSADGSTLLAQEGQFDTTPDPNSSPRYLKGSATYSVTRQAQTWTVERFGPLAR